MGNYGFLIVVVIGLCIQLYGVWFISDRDKSKRVNKIGFAIVALAAAAHFITG